MSTIKLRRHKFIISLSAAVTWLCISAFVTPCCAASFGEGLEAGPIGVSESMPTGTGAGTGLDIPASGEVPDNFSAQINDLVMTAARADFPTVLAGRNGWEPCIQDESKIVMENLNGKLLTMDEEGVYLKNGPEVKRIHATEKYVYITSDVMPDIYSCPSLRFWQLDKLAEENGFTSVEELAETEVRKYVKTVSELIYTVVVERDSIALHTDSLASELPGAVSTIRCQVHSNTVWVANPDYIFWAVVPEPVDNERI